MSVGQWTCWMWCQRSRYEGIAAPEYSGFCDFSNKNIFYVGV
ncbi:MAG: hypothetical protein AB4290_04005 [Spirulina sp.]